MAYNPDDYKDQCSLTPEVATTAIRVIETRRDAYIKELAAGRRALQPGMIDKIRADIEQLKELRDFVALKAEADAIRAERGEPASEGDSACR